MKSCQGAELEQATSSLLCPDLLTWGVPWCSLPGVPQQRLYAEALTGPELWTGLPIGPAMCPLGVASPWQRLPTCPCSASTGTGQCPAAPALSPESGSRLLPRRCPWPGASQALQAPCIDWGRGCGCWNPSGPLAIPEDEGRSLDSMGDLGQVQASGGCGLDHQGSPGQGGVGWLGMPQVSPSYSPEAGRTSLTCRLQAWGAAGPHAGQASNVGRGPVGRQSWLPEASPRAFQFCKCSVSISLWESSLFPSHLSPLTSSSISSGDLLLIFPVFVYCFKEFFSEIPSPSKNI